MGCTRSTIDPESIPSKIVQAHQKLKDTNSGSLFSTSSSNQFNESQMNLKELQILYYESNGDQNKYFELLEEKISQRYLRLSKETLEYMNNKSFIGNQSKVYISEEILSMNLNIMSMIGTKTDHKFNPSTYKKLNKMQKNLIGFIKSKYPRSAQSFVPGDLMKAFKSFSIVENPEADILKNGNYYFGSADTRAIAKGVKMFINSLIDQLDTKFPVFEKLLQEKAFIIESEKGTKNVNYKIGRKLPENISKYTDLDTNSLQIRNPQVFRVLIKWVEDMEQYLLDPEQEVEEKKFFKTVTQENEKYEFDDINSLQFESLKHQLISKLENQKQSYSEDLENLRKDMDSFNNNLVKILDKGQRIQKYVPKKQAQVIKYAMFNTKLLSWMLAQKLMLVMKRLIQIGRSFGQSQHMLNLDLIKFNVTDMMRAMISGSKKDIISVYQNLLKLQNQGQIRIVKIKNRLSTPLNDVMIIFTMKNSFLICQLQLILAEGQSGHQKLKNIETLNHFFYQLERSPYGVLAELAVVLGYKDSKINYQNKIHFTKTEINVSDCLKTHPNQVKQINIQKKPFLCTNCTVFYEAFQNPFIMKVCNLCNNYLCHRCIFQKQKGIQVEYSKTQFNNFMEQQIKYFLNSNKKNLNQKNATLNLNMLVQFFEPKVYKLIDIAKGSNYLKPQKLGRWIKEEKGDLPIYFILVQFKMGQILVKSLLWNNILKEFELTFYTPNQLTQGNEIKFGDFDFIQFYKSGPMKQNPDNENYVYLNLFKRGIKYENVESYYGIYQGSIFFVADAKQFKKQTKDQNLFGIEDYLLSSKRKFKFPTINDARAKLPNIKNAKQVYELVNEGITVQLLNYFKQISWKTSVRSINLSRNKLLSVQVVLENCVCLENLYVAENFIDQIKFIKVLPKLHIFNASSNRVRIIEHINNIPEIRRLNLESNELEQFPSKANLLKLKFLDLSQNKMSGNHINTANFPCLLQLIMNTSYIYQQVSNNPGENNLILKFEKLKNLVMNGTYGFKQVQIDCPSLERITITETLIQIFKIKFFRLVKYLNLSSNPVQSLSFLQNADLQNLQKLIVERARVKIFPLIKAQNLKIISFRDCEITKIDNIQKCKFPMLQFLDIEPSTFKVLPPISGKKLQTLNISRNPILKDISSLQNSDFNQLFELKISLCQKLERIPTLSFPKLQILNLQAIKSQNLNKFAKSNLPCLQELNLDFFEGKQLPILNFPQLKILRLNSSRINKFEWLEQSNIPKLKQLHLTQLITVQNQNFNNPIMKKFPRLNLPQLEMLYFEQSGFSDFSQLSNCNFPKLTSINFYKNKLQQLPILKFPSLQQVNANHCGLKTVNNLKESILPELRSLYLAKNQLKQLPQLNFPNLEYLQISLNQIDNLDNLIILSTKIETLNFSNNSITKINKLIFPTISTLIFSFNPLIDLHGLSLSQLTNLKILTINSSSNSIQSFPILKLSNLVSINFSLSKLKSADNLQFCQLPQIDDINFQNNQIQNLPKILLPSLKNCSFSGNQIKNIQNISSWQCQLLSCLNLNQNSIQKIPKFNFPNLKVLYLYLNKIININQFNQSQLPKLQTLKININELQTIPSFKNKIKELDISNNKIQNCKQVQKYHQLIIFSINQNPLKQASQIHSKNLQTLYFQNCQLTNIDCLFQESLHNLKYANFKENKIEKICKIDAFYLRILTLSANKISDIQEFAKSQLKSLQSLYLNNNQLQSIQKFPHLQQLTNLNLSNNEFLTNVDGLGHAQYPNLNRLELANCKLKKIPIIIAPKLEYLILQHNQIDSIELLPKLKCPKLSSLVLTQNRITKLCKIEFPNLREFLLQENPINNISNFLESKLSDNIYLPYSLKIQDEKKMKSLISQIRNKYSSSICINEENYEEQSNFDE